MSVQKAIEVLFRELDGVLDKAGNTVIDHSLRVAHNQPYAYGTDMHIAAILHDVVEDSSYTLDQVEKEFGLYVRQLVDALSRRKGEEYLSGYIERLIKPPYGGGPALDIKLTDIQDHLRDISHIPMSMVDRYLKAKKRLEDVKSTR